MSHSFPKLVSLEIGIIKGRCLTKCVSANARLWGPGGGGHEVRRSDALGGSLRWKRRLHQLPPPTKFIIRSTRQQSKASITLQYLLGPMASPPHFYPINPTTNVDSTCLSTYKASTYFTFLDSLRFPCRFLPTITVNLHPFLTSLLRSPQLGLLEDRQSFRRTLATYPFSVKFILSSDSPARAESPAT